MFKIFIKKIEFVWENNTLRIFIPIGVGGARPGLGCGVTEKENAWILTYKQNFKKINNVVIKIFLWIYIFWRSTKIRLSNNVKDYRSFQ